MQFDLGSIRIYEPYPVLVNHRLAVLFKSSGQVKCVGSGGFAVENRINYSIISINAYLGTDGIKMISDEDQKQRRIQDEVLGAHPR